MTYEEIRAMVAEESTDVVYLVDCHSYELLYLNRTAREVFGITQSEQWQGRKCHAVMHGTDGPCDSCINRLVDPEASTRQHLHTILGKLYMARDWLLEINGRRVRLTIASLIQNESDFSQQLQRQLQIEETLVACVQTLTRTSDSEQAIGQLLAIIGSFFSADRAYIFEIEPRIGVASNTYEWCEAGITPQKHKLQQISLQHMERWLEQFRRYGEFYISCLDAVDHDTAEYQILHEQGIVSLLAAPLMRAGEVIGFLGVDNPSANTDAMTLLRSVGAFITNDINKRQLLEEMKQLSFMDSLTSVGNRRLYNDTFARLSKQKLHSLGVIFIDLDGLKRANDLHGHQFGDYLIRHVAETLSALFRDSVYRIGGDEFVILCPNTTHEQFEKQLGELEELSRTDMNLHYSIGTSWREGNVDLHRQVTYADEQMYKNKQAYCTRDDVRRESMDIAHRLMQELDEGQFVVHLQPRINLKLNCLEGAEALVRRKNPEGNGLLLPDSFIAWHESRGQVQYIDLYVFDQVCAMLHSWREMGIAELRITVNFSQVTLMQPNLVDTLQTICMQYDIAPMWLTIEVGKGVPDVRHEALVFVLNQLRDAGFPIALDNFGARDSDVILVSAVRFNEISVDRALISRLPEDERAGIILDHTIRLCRGLDWTTMIAEGVETKAQLEQLQALDCDVAQGFYFDAPLSVAAFTEKYLYDNEYA